MVEVTAQPAVGPQENGPQEKRHLNISMPNVINMVCSIIHQSFFKQDKIKTKALLKDLKAGGHIALGAVTVSPKTEGESEPEAQKEDGVKIPIFLALDYSEFCGGFNRPDFLAALQQMLNRIGATINKRQDLNVMTDQNTGTMLVHQPGFIERDGQLNVMNMVIEQAPKGGMVFKLAFFNPEQYIQAAKEGETSAE